MDLHPQLHRRPEPGDQGTVRPGDHVITTDLEHNSVSRPLRALEKAGAITLTRLASDRGYIDPDAIRGRPHPEDPARRHDARLERARDGAADRGDRPDRPRGRRAVPRRCGAVGRRDPDRPSRHADRLACLPRPQGALRPDGHRGPLRGPRSTARSAAWREGGTGGDSSSETQPTTYPYFLEGGHAQRAGRRGPGRGRRLGHGARARKPSGGTRSICSDASSTGSSAPTAGRSPGAGTRPPTSGRSR